MVTCWRTIDPTLAGVMRVGAMLAFVRVLSPPKVGQSALFAATAAPRPTPPALRCWPTEIHTGAIIAIVRKQIVTGFFIDALCFCRRVYWWKRPVYAAFPIT